MRRVVLGASMAVLLVTPLAAWARATEPPPARLTFEVASIKSSQADLGAVYGIKPLPGGTGYTAENVPLKLMMALMYKIPMRQIIGGPAWVGTDRFDIEARAEAPASVDDLHLMFQSLLAERFALKFHKETKEGPVYALTVDKAGLKMKADGSGQAMAIPILPAGTGTFTGKQVPMQYLTWWLGQQVQNDGRPVVDETGLKESYDFTIAFLPPLPPSVARDSLPPELQQLPSVFDAVRDQLGLKLEAAKGPVEYYVIDQVQKPTPN